MTRKGKTGKSRRGGRRTKKSRRGRKVKSYSISEQGGELLIVDGLLGSGTGGASSGGNSNLVAIERRELGNAGSGILSLAKGALMGNRGGAGEARTGALVIGFGKVLKATGVRSPTLKLGRKIRLRLWS